MGRNIQADEMGTRILQEPKQDLRRAKNQKVKVTNNGEVQQDVPNLHIVVNPAYILAKRYLDKSLAHINKVRTYVVDPSLAPPDVAVQQGPRGGYFYDSNGRQRRQEEEPTQEQTQPKSFLSPSPAKAWDGEQIFTKNQLSKLETGQLGEDIALEYVKSLGFADAAPLNSKQNNFPIDAIGDHHVFEIKTGLVSNGRSAQQWRATIGQPGKAEAEWLATASAEEKAQWNFQKSQAIIDRKNKALAELEAEAGHKITPKTLAMIINPDTQTVDLYQFDGFHLRIGWKGQEKNLVGSFRYGS